MSLLNRFFNLSPHLRTAIILAPLLGIAGYIAAGYYAANKQPPVAPIAALALKPTGECRLAAAECRFQRDGLQINLKTQATENGDTLIILEPSAPLQGGVMGIHSHGNETPRNLRRIKGEDNWYLQFSGKLETPVKIRLITVRNGASYFAEVMAR